MESSTELRERQILNNLDKWTINAECNVKITTDSWQKMSTSLPKTILQFERQHSFKLLDDRFIFRFDAWADACDVPQRKRENVAKIESRNTNKHKHESSIEKHMTKIKKMQSDIYHTIRRRPLEVNTHPDAPRSLEKCLKNAMSLDNLHSEGCSSAARRPQNRIVSRKPQYH